MTIYIDCTSSEASWRPANEKEEQEEQEEQDVTASNEPAQDAPEPEQDASEPEQDAPEQEQPEPEPEQPEQEQPEQVQEQDAPEQEQEQEQEQPEQKQEREQPEQEECAESGAPVSEWDGFVMDAAARTIGQLKKRMREYGDQNAHMRHKRFGDDAEGRKEAKHEASMSVALAALHAAQDVFDEVVQDMMEI